MGRGGNAGRGFNRNLTEGVVTVRFDDSLPIFAKIIAELLGDQILIAGTILRDAVGRLTFYANDDLDEAVSAKVHDRVHVELGSYAGPDRVLVGRSDYGWSIVFDDKRKARINVDGRRISLVDRRLVGADWLRAPAPASLPPSRFVFSSIKGGVGRSTALSVAAADLASRGYRVLVIDLDMEAPGLGAMLLTNETLPLFGTIDALLESAIGPLDNVFLADLVGPSALADQSGKIDVIPAFGRRSIDNPGDVLAKIARAYADSVQPDGQVATILDRVRGLVDVFADSTRYDAILVDARAGLHETTASAIMGLGAEVFLFGVDEPQTFQGYSALLAHLARFADPEASVPEWLGRMTIVHAKASEAPSEQSAFAERCGNLLSETGLAPKQRALDEVPLPAGAFSDVPWNDEISDNEVLLEDEWSARDPLVITNDPNFSQFDPCRRPDLLSRKVYESSFGDFLDHINASIFAGGGGGK